MYLKTAIEEKYIPEPNTGCWLWIRRLDKQGYGRAKLKGKKIGAHRFSWMEHNGPIPKDLFVLHKCDTPACINPNHLFLGTARDNFDDMVRKGRDNFNRSSISIKDLVGFCMNGHVWDIGTYFTRPKDGKRICRKCRAAKKMRYYYKNKLKNGR